MYNKDVLDKRKGRFTAVISRVSFGSAWTNPK